MPGGNPKPPPTPSAGFGRPSGALTERADHPTFRGIVAAEGVHLFLGQGGVPLMRDGAVIGGTGLEDEDCAQAGADTLSNGA
ncbi:MAG: heme-binding protein [Alphaproteobacteria bacterium]|nr:heme-binding protein [Alphaproteobacteria bacterium]